MAGTALGPQIGLLQKLTAQAIVNIFETGRISGVYGQITLIPGDPGHLTYGRSQTTLASGNLYLLVKDYCDAAGSFAKDLQQYLPALLANDLSLDTNVAFRTLLREAGDDPVMHDVQDKFFDRVYWVPAVTSAQRCGISTPLGVAVVYDGTVHGSFGKIRDLTTQQLGAIGGAITEQAWIQKYVDLRRDWLANSSIVALHPCVYRMDAFKQLITDNKWQLELPLKVRGCTIDESVLTQPASARVSAEHPDVRILRAGTPPMAGDDVKAVQVALQAKGYSCTPSGTFDDATAAQVTAFQTANRLKADGMVGPATRAALGL